MFYPAVCYITPCMDTALMQLFMLINMQNMPFMLHMYNAAAAKLFEYIRAMSVMA